MHLDPRCYFTVQVGVYQHNFVEVHVWPVVNLHIMCDALNRAKVS